jgi:hypothetical protein
MVHGVESEIHGLEFGRSTAAEMPWCSAGDAAAKIEAEKEWAVIVDCVYE